MHAVKHRYFHKNILNPKIKLCRKRQKYSWSVRWRQGKARQGKGAFEGEGGKRRKNNRANFISSVYYLSFTSKLRLCSVSVRDRLGRGYQSPEGDTDIIVKIVNVFDLPRMRAIPTQVPTIARMLP